MTVPARSHRERFRTLILTILGAQVAFLLVLLLHGYRAESSPLSVPAEESASPPAPPPAIPATLPRQAAPAPAATSLLVEAALPAAVTPTKETASATPEAFATIYVVKSGDTLNRIARAHGTTIRALKAANNLPGERLGVGLKLRIPTAK